MTWARLAVALACVVAVVILWGRAPAQARPQAPAARLNGQARTLRTFVDRVEAYVALHRKLEATLPALGAGSTADQIAPHQDALARLIRGARRNTRAGDIFSADVRGLFRALIERALRRPAGGQSLDMLPDASEVRVRLAVNATYPRDAPVSSVPPVLLAELPRLPDEVEYRFNDRNLFLRDTHANLIVDYMLKARP